MVIGKMMKGETDCGSCSLTPNSFSSSTTASTSTSTVSMSRTERRTRRCLSLETLLLSYNRPTLFVPKVLVISLCIASLYCQQSSAFSGSAPLHYLHSSTSSSYHRHTNEAVKSYYFNGGAKHIQYNKILSPRTLDTFSSTQLSVRKKKPMPIVGYNGQEICDYYDRSPLVVGWRLNILSLPLLG